MKNNITLMQSNKLNTIEKNFSKLCEIIANKIQQHKEICDIYKT